jgi:hypothetical protein
MKNFFWALAHIVALFSCCETDFELNAPYKTIPVVYGLLDQSLDTQFVKINKSYLADVNNANFAPINDCTQFDYILAVLEEYNQNNVYLGSDTLQEMMVGNLEPGIFYEDSQKIYFLETSSNSFVDEHTYKLNVNVPDKNLNFSAQTDLVNGTGLSFDFLSKITLQLNGFRCADKDLATTDEYFDPRLDWKTTLNGKRYELVLRFAYVEHFFNGDTIQKFIDWDLGDQTSVNTDGGESMFKVVSGSSFFEMLKGRLSSYDLEDQVEKRTFNSNSIEFILTAGNEDLNTYMQINEPVTSIVTERPIFTNVNNGIGLFASKYQTELVCSMSAGTILELCLGQKTSGYKFCLPNINTPFYQNSLTELDLYPQIECN